MRYAALALLLVLSACASTGNVNAKNQDLIGQIEIGKSTKDDVRRLFGEANSVSRMASQVASAGNPSQTVTVTEWWSYHHASAQTDPKTFIPIIGGLVGSTTVESEHVQFGFDQKGLVQYMTSGQNKAKSGGMLSQ